MCIIKIGIMKLSSSKKLNISLTKMGIFDYFDVVEHIPYRYEDFHKTPYRFFKNKEKIVVHGKLLSPFVRVSIQKSIIVVNAKVEDDNHHIFNINAFNRPYLTKIFKAGDEVVISGSYDAIRKSLNVINIIKGIPSEDNLIKPIYSLPVGIENHVFHHLVERAFTNIHDRMLNYVPFKFLEKYKLLDKEQSLKLLHFPKKMDDIRIGNRYLKYEECLIFTLRNKYIRKQNELIQVPKTKINLNYLKIFIKKMPYNLTDDQKNALVEIIQDMNDEKLMYRLLQGDVGSGKTLVAALSMYSNFLRNEQSVIMAPTDTLARQHYETLLNLFDGEDISIALLVGKMSREERENIKSGLISGAIDIVVGTHALFSHDIEYKNLGLVVIDEQHRFGVNQRNMMLQKGDRADLLLMSATPIPRSLALTIYGDLDVSTLRSFPNKKRSVKTKIVKSTDTIIKNTIEEALYKNQNIFIIAPLISEGLSEKKDAESLYYYFNKIYPGLVSLLHGKMPVDEKMYALEKFKNKETPIIIATSVIEVGIDIKDANTLIVYDANCFGLASLHQLRGRIGRHGQEATCLLIDDEDDEDHLQRLKILEKSNDGFLIASEDLKLRGPGEMFGLRQSGLPNFQFANIVSDFRIFECARDDANEILKTPEKYSFLLKHIARLTENQKDDRD